MILAVMAGLATVMQVAAPPSPPPDDDIVVIGQRLKNLQITMKRDRKTGMKRCVIRPTSGDLVLDTGICDIYLSCVPKVETADALKACMTPTLKELVGSWVERRRTAAHHTP